MKGHTMTKYNELRDPADPADLDDASIFDLFYDLFYDVAIPALVGILSGLVVAALVVVAIGLMTTCASAGQVETSPRPVERPADKAPARGFGHYDCAGLAPMRASPGSRGFGEGTLAPSRDCVEPGDER
jgi:hypothetical protein